MFSDSLFDDDGGGEHNGSDGDGEVSYGRFDQWQSCQKSFCNHGIRDDVAIQHNSRQ